MPVSKKTASVAKLLNMANTYLASAGSSRARAEFLMLVKE